MKRKSKKIKKSTSRLINPIDGSMRPATQIHNHKKKYTRKTKQNDNRSDE